MQPNPSKAHLALGPDFYDEVEPASFPTLTLRHRDQRAAATVGLETLTDSQWLAHFGRFEPLEGTLQHPIALRYHGHQFRHYNPDLGDGRGFLFAQLHDLQDGRLLDLGTKGSGTTPWSRSGDGRLTLKGGVRELLATSMLEALGVNTSKTFSLIETGERLERHDEPSPTRAAVLVRLNHSHIRIGSFQRLAYLDQPENLLRLLDHTIRTHMPALWHKDPGTRAAAFLTEVAARCAHLGAAWMAAGFVHGVLNTDNINVTGESFDYGPWRFIPYNDPAFTAAYFDHNGLYAYARQPDTLLWNLVRLAECLLPLAGKEPLQAAIETFPPAYHAAQSAALLRRLGLAPSSPEQDQALSTAWWHTLEQTKTPFERAFFDNYANRDPHRAANLPPEAAQAWAPVQDLLDAYDPAQTATPNHPYFAAPAPCTMLIEDVEALWSPIADHDDWRPLAAKLEAIEQMRQAYAGDPL